MKIVVAESAWDDYLYWQKEDKRLLKRINALIADITNGDPYEGIGKPEPLQHELSGWWSRRINQEQRIIYRIKEVDGKTQPWIAQCRYHY